MEDDVSKLFFTVPIGCKNLVTEEDVPELDLAVVSVDVPKESARFVADYLERRLC
ncbi:MAG: hypothetical protein HQK96_01450, partial [Nitrospirae bacterium]|nr:hypothetical protein [Nitrospirota bacterium]